MRGSLILGLAGALLATAGVAAPVQRTKSAAARPAAKAAAVTGWLSWRGPDQTGVSHETGLVDTWKLGGANDLWSYKLASGGTPVLANGKLFVLGYEGEGPNLQEVFVCLDANTGKKLWERRYNDYLSDVVYDRYAIGYPAVDPATGNVIVLTAAGYFSCYTPAGKLLWEHPMMEEFGKLTFPNGRTGGPIVDGNLVIVRGITSNWGGEGPASDRFYAFDTASGKLVWSSTPGGPPKDNSFARPFLGWRNGKRVFYTGTGDGQVSCVNARTGEPIFRFPLSAGGINSSVVLYKNLAVAIHNDENLDTSEIGRMVAVKVDTEPKAPVAGVPGAPEMPATAEAWRNELGTVSSSPLLVGNRIYQASHTGQLCCVDADTGKIIWRHKLAPDQLHASPLYADGKIYIPMQNGLFYILKPGETDCKELCKVQLAGRCLGQPIVWGGKFYVTSTERIYCFGNKAGGKPAVWPKEPATKPGVPVALQIVPAEVLLRPGSKATFEIRGIDANGLVTGTYPANQAVWAKYIPPTARVRAEMSGSFNAAGELVADAAIKPSAGAFQATIGNLKGTIRGRVLPDLPFKEDFEGYNISETHATEADTKFAYPPLPWIGARFKFEVREHQGTKVLAKTLDNIFFQRATVFFGRPESSNYTVEADVMSDGNRRTMSTVGLINQRYLISMVGNAQTLQVTSNEERIKEGVPFKWETKTWYRLKTRVDVAADGSGVVRAKAWKRGEPEPAAWNLEVKHRQAHTMGSPGLFGFSPQSLFRVYVDNLAVTPNS